LKEKEMQEEDDLTWINDYYQRSNSQLFKCYW